MDNSISGRASSDPCSAATPWRWSLSDVLDFEHYAVLDDSGDHTSRQDVVRRDRRFFTNCVAPSLLRSGFDPEGDTKRYRRTALRHWLELRRSEEPAALRSLLPGQVFERSARLATILLVAIGLFIGGGVAAGLLQYGDAKTINVTWFLFVLVGLQACLVLVTAVAWMLQRTRLVQDLHHDLSVIGYLMKPLVRWVMERVRESRLDALSPRIKARARARQGALDANLSLYGPVYALSVFKLAQWFGIAFNLGVLATTSAVITGKDLAFGWETSHDDLAEEQVAAIVAVSSLPWKWFLGEGVGYPSLEQIAVTRTYKGEAIADKPRADLHSWSWFLIFSVLTYGLLPRVLLLVLVNAAIRASTVRIPISGDDLVFARMATESMEFQGPEMPPEAGMAPHVGPLEPMSMASGETAGLAIGAGGCLLLLHVDLRSLGDGSALADIALKLRGATGWQVEKVAVFGASSTQDAEVMALVRNSEWQDSQTRIAVLLNGASPPITENERFLRTLRHSAGNRAAIRIGLLGRARRDERIRPIRTFHLDLWSQMVAGLADPLMMTFPLAGVEEDKP